MAGAVIAWIGIGLAASLSAMIWPMRRDVLGVVLNMASAIVGAVILGFIGLGIGAYPRADAGRSYLFAAVGALLALGVLHLVVFYGPRRLVEKHHR